jgi:hypothetical protein
MPEVSINTSPQEKQGAGNAGGFSHTHGLMYEWKKDMSGFTRGLAESTGIPCAMVLTGSFVHSPVSVTFWSPSPVDRLHRLSTSPGHQDQTPLPSAFVPHAMRHIRVHRIPSRVSWRSQAALIGMERANHDFDLGVRQAQFLKTVTCASIRLNPFTNSVFQRRRFCGVLALPVSP